MGVRTVHGEKRYLISTNVNCTSKYVLSISEAWMCSQSFWPLCHKVKTKVTVDNSRVQWPVITVEIPQQLRSVVSYRDTVITEYEIVLVLGLLRLEPGAVSHWLYIVSMSEFSRRIYNKFLQTHINVTSGYLSTLNVHVLRTQSLKFFVTLQNFYGKTELWSEFALTAKCVLGFLTSMAGLCVLVSGSHKPCKPYLSIWQWKMHYINGNIYK